MIDRIVRRYLLALACLLTVAVLVIAAVTQGAN